MKNTFILKGLKSIPQYTYYSNSNSLYIDNMHL